jgi:hypothetical protein
MSSAMLAKTKNSDLPEWTSTNVYGEIYHKLESLKGYLEDNEDALDRLTVREKTFLSWKIRAIEGMLFCTSDTEEESSRDESSEGGSASPCEQVQNVVVKKPPKSVQKSQEEYIEPEGIFAWD